MTILLALMSSCCANCEPESKAKTHQELLSDFVELRHGMFICYNIMSYGAKWGEANYPIDDFNPTKLDCEQWAKAALSANMTFGVLTTKHHEGFALWDSSCNEYDVASTPYKKDIVRQYVDAFRRNGLRVGLYYSIWDATNGVDKGEITPEKLNFIKQEITELLTNYGDIDYFVVDGWFWRMGHREVPYSEIRNLIRDLQPNCLLTDHTHLQAPYQVDIPYFEAPFGAFPSENNTMASALGHCAVRGNGWFWSEKSPEGLVGSAEDIVEMLSKCEARYCNFMLNCMPNRDGVLDPLYIKLLGDIGKLWSPNMNRAQLPEQPKSVLYDAPIVAAQATSGEAFNLIAAQQMGTVYTEWISDEQRSQAITLDLGVVYDNINILNFVQAHNCKPAPERSLTGGNITKCKLSYSLDDEEYALISEVSWEADAQMRSFVFDDTKLRYLRLEISDFNGDNAIITEVQVGNYKDQLLK